MKSTLLAVLGCMIAILFWGCESGQVKTGGSIEMSATTGISSAAVTPTPLPQDTSLPSPETEQPAFERGAYFSQHTPEAIHSFIDRSQDFHIGQIQIGGEFIPALDTLMLDENKLRELRQIVVHADNIGLRTFLRVQEIPLTKTLTALKWESPLVVARQTACRNALRRVPGIDGIVLQIDRHYLPSWQFTTPVSEPDAGQAIDIAFTIEMMKQIVVDEFGKELIVSVGSDNASILPQIRDTVRRFDDPSVSLMAPSGMLAKGQAEWIEMDLPGSTQNAQYLLFGNPDGLLNEWKRLDTGNVKGMVAQVDFHGGSILHSANEINLWAYAALEPGKKVLSPTLWEEWVQKHFDVLPISDEGRFLVNLYRQAEDFRQSAFRMYDWFEYRIPSNPLENISISNRIGKNDRFTQYLQTKLAQPGAQTMQDIDQENFKEQQTLQETMDKLDRMFSYRLSHEMYEDLQLRLERLRWLCDVYSASKSSHLGMLRWTQTQDETEALALEYHLQRLESLERNANELFPEAMTPVSTDAIAHQVQSIRERFPKVLLGARDRQWLKIYDVEFAPSGLEALEVSWKTEQPAQSRIYITQSPPVFDRVVSPGIVPQLEHRMQIDQLKQGETYYIKLQTIGMDGQITNSPYYEIRVGSPPIM